MLCSSSLIARTISSVAHSKTILLQRWWEYDYLTKVTQTALWQMSTIQKCVGLKKIIKRSCGL